MRFVLRACVLCLPFGAALAVALSLACSDTAGGPRDQNCCTDAGAGYKGPDSGGFEPVGDAGDAADGSGEAGDAVKDGGGEPSDAAAGDGSADTG